jgi:hypothetical protein
MRQKLSIKFYVKLIKSEIRLATYVGKETHVKDEPHLCELTSLKRQIRTL